MKQEAKAIILICDCCGERYRNEEGFACYVGDEDGSQIREHQRDAEEPEGRVPSHSARLIQREVFNSQREGRFTLSLTTVVFRDLKSKPPLLFRTNN